MSKDVLLYGSISSWSARDFITAINDAGTEDITVRVNSEGGDVMYCWGMIAKFSEVKGNKLVKCDGKAYSMGAFFFCYADEAEAIDSAEFVFHRAAYPSWIESNPEYFTEEAKAGLSNMNKHLRKAMEAKIDVEAFEKMTNTTIDQIFSMESRIDVRITAQQAKKIGLINKIINLTPTKKAEIEAEYYQAVAKYISPDGSKELPKQTENKQTPKNKTMTIDQIKNEHPAVYAAIVETAVKAERERAKVWAHFADLDPKAVKEGIAGGEAMDDAQKLEFMEKRYAAKAKVDISKENARDVETTEAKPEADAEAKKLEAFEKELEKHITKK
jgi:ATP-dependent protease ClpP protease subunit